MRTLIAYATKKGSARDVALRMKESIGTDVDLIDLSKVRRIDLEVYDRIIIGSSIRVGQLLKPATKFLESYGSVLVHKQIGLYVCGLRENEAETCLEMGYGRELVDRASATASFGGRYRHAEHGPLVHALMKKVSGIETDVDTLRYDRVGAFVQKVMAA